MDKVLELIRSLATSMGQTTAYLWPKAVLYQWVVSLGVAIVEPLIFFTAFVVFVNAVKKGIQRRWPEDKELYIQLVPSAIIAVISGMFFAFDFVDRIAGIVSPEGAMLMRLLGK